MPLRSAAESLILPSQMRFVGFLCDFNDYLFFWSRIGRISSILDWLWQRFSCCRNTMTDTKPSPVQLVNCFQIFSYDAYSWRKVHDSILGNPLNVTAQNTVFEVSAGLEKSRQGVSGCSAHPAETRWRYFRRRGSNFGRRESVDAPDENFTTFW